MRVGIVADDLTGLNAVACEFQRFGISVATCLSAHALTSMDHDFDVVGIDTNTRAMDRGDAVRLVDAATRALMDRKPDWIFKQTDSALHGHVAAEIETFLAASRRRAVLFAPACPSMSRITRDGMHHVDNNAASIDIARLWRDQGGGSITLSSIHRLGRQQVIPEGVTVLDAESDHTLDGIVAFADVTECRVFAGAVGLAKALSRHLGKALSSDSKPALLLLGSHQGRTRLQLDAMASGGAARVFELPAEPSDAGALDEVVDLVTATLRAGAHAILCPSAVPLLQTGSGYPYLDPAARLGVEVCTRIVGQAVVERCRADICGIVVAGGATSEITAREILGAQVLERLTHISDGVAGAFARTAGGSTMPIVTKAGNWGDIDALMRAVLWLQSPDAHLLQYARNRQHG